MSGGGNLLGRLLFLSPFINEPYIVILTLGFSCLVLDGAIIVTSGLPRQLTYSISHRGRLGRCHGNTPRLPPIWLKSDPCEPRGVQGCLVSPLLNSTTTGLKGCSTVPLAHLLSCCVTGLHQPVVEQCSLSRTAAFLLGRQTTGGGAAASDLVISLQSPKRGGAVKVVIWQRLPKGGVAPLAAYLAGHPPRGGRTR